ncbi:hypothetical protein AAC387_Pa04g2515 [Persea americana]
MRRREGGKERPFDFRASCSRPLQGKSSKSIDKEKLRRRTLSSHGSSFFYFNFSEQFALCCFIAFCISSLCPTFCLIHTFPSGSPFPMRRKMNRPVGHLG